MKLFSGSGNSANKPKGNSYNSDEAYYESKNPKNKKKGKGWLIALAVVLALVLAVFLYWKISTKPPELIPPDASGDIEDSNYTEERYYTLLVVGDDQEGGNTDTMMLLRFDTVENAVNILSIPRDTMINSTLSNKKINAIYHNKDGIESLKDELEKITGFRANNYVVVNTDIFIDVVDALGGVDFNVPFDMDYDDWSDWDKDGVAEYEFHIHVSEGQQTLNGYDALGVFRWRHNTDYKGHVYTNPDIDRISMQHDLLLAIVDKAMSTKNIATLIGIADSMRGKYETDLEWGNIQWYIGKLMKMSMESLNFYTAPTSGLMINEVAYVALNVDEWIPMVNESVNPYDKPVTAEDCEILQYRNGKIDYRGFMIVNSKDCYCTNGAAVNPKFITAQ